MPTEEKTVWTEDSFRLFMKKFFPNATLERRGDALVIRVPASECAVMMDVENSEGVRGSEFDHWWNEDEDLSCYCGETYAARLVEQRIKNAAVLAAVRGRELPCGLHEECEGGPCRIHTS